jgi:hypothetical protein
LTSAYRPQPDHLKTSFEQSPFVAAADDRIIPPRRKFGCGKNGLLVQM